MIGAVFSLAAIRTTGEATQTVENVQDRREKEVS